MRSCRILNVFSHYAMPKMSISCRWCYYYTHRLLTTYSKENQSRWQHDWLFV